MSYGNYLQPEEGVYIDTLTARVLNNGQGNVSSFAATGTTLSGVNISNFNYNIYTMRVGNYAHLEFDSPTVNCTADQDITFRIPYPLPVSRINVDATTSFGKVNVIFNDINGTSYAGLLTAVPGLRLIEATIVSPIGCSNCVMHGSFTLKLD